jgi:AraC-like DNA-binding protein
MLRRLEPGVYCGTSTRLYDGAGLTVDETCFAPDLSIPQHEHANPFFCLVLGGHGTRSWPSRSGRDAPMGLTLFPAGLPHANCWHGSGGHVLHVELASHWCERLGDAAKVLREPGDFNDGPSTWLARRLAGECRAQDAVTPLVVEGLVLELLAACVRTHSDALRSHPPRWLRTVDELLHDRLAQPLRMDELAAAAGVSVDHLARVFRRVRGCSVGEYLRRLRIQWASERLVHGEEPLAEIALAAGFADQSHFTRLFRQAFGVTPGAYRAASARRSRSNA